MKMIKKNSRRIEIFVDQALLRRIRDLAEEMGIEEYILLPTLGGKTRHGRWHDDQVTGGAGSKVIFLAYLNEDRANEIIGALQPLMKEYGLFIASSNAEIIFKE